MRQRRAKKVRFFTLFEMLLVIALTGLVFGGGGFALFSGFKKQKFEKGVEVLVSKINLCQEIMLDYDIDCTLTLKQQTDGLSTRLTPFGQLPSHILRRLHLNTNIASITSQTFNDQIQKEIILYFDSTGAKIPRGKLTLIGAKEMSLWLPGYPYRGGLNQKKPWQDEEKPPPYPKDSALFCFN